MGKPIVAIVGRPNVGKSTLFNIFANSRISIVEDTPGVTRDRLYATAEWLDHEFMMVDTGGIEIMNADAIAVSIRQQAQIAIREADVMLAAASNALIIGFNFRPDVGARKMAEKENIQINTYRVIYEAIEDVKAALSGMLDPDIKEVELGQAEVRSTFKVPKVGLVAGCYVTEGKITRNARVRVVRDGVVIHDGSLGSLKRFKDDVKEVATGYECGLGFERFNDIKEGDILEAYTFEEVKRAL